MSKWVAQIIQTDFLSRNIRFVVAQDSPNGTLYAQPNGESFYQTQPGEAPPSDVDVVWSLPGEAAHAVLAMVSRHLGAVEHPEQLRGDYIAERNRVDKLINHLIGVR